MKLLILIGLILLIIAVHQLLRIIELSREFRKTTEWQVTNNDNSFQGKIMLLFGIVFIALFFYQIHLWGDKMLPTSGSEHGVHLDALWDFNMYMILTAFIITNAILFYFAYKYRGRKDAVAAYYPHNSKLELLWTSIPAAALTFVVIFVLKSWHEITSPSTNPDRIEIELYAKQFDWTARYAGFDKKLGSTDYRQIDGKNMVGMDTLDATGFDDIIVKNEFHIPVGKEVVFKIRSRDVIHSAYMPHFRAQMNCVPGMVTEFKFTPIKTTEEMRKDPYVVNLMKGINEIRAKKGEEPVEFDYQLMCNKICGASHYNMQMTIVVESEKDYKNWLLKQPRFKKRVASK